MPHVKHVKASFGIYLHLHPAWLFFVLAMGGNVVSFSRFVRVPWGQYRSFFCFRSLLGGYCKRLFFLLCRTQVQPDEIYNLGAMSHVKVSFEMSEYTAEADGVGVLRLLNAIRSAGLEQKTRLYQVRPTFFPLGEKWG